MTRPEREAGRAFAVAETMDVQIVTCGACGQANRAPRVESGKKVVCGRCKALLDARDNSGGGSPVAVTDASFAATIAQGPWIVDFWAAWCGPCRTIAPILDEIASERADVRIAKLNVDENPRTAASFRVQGIPLLVYFLDGVETGRVTGAVPRNQIEAGITRFLRK